MQPEPAAPIPPSETLRFGANGDEIRGALCALDHTLRAAGADGDLCVTTEIVLAEVLNNIAEHAYREQGGPIDMEWCLDAQTITCRIQDEGFPLPGLALPPGDMPSLEDPADLPEGGFGWALIHTLTQELIYTRQGTQNILSLTIAAPPQTS